MNTAELQDAVEGALNLIIRFEGFKDTAYRCPAGVWTIGFGRTNGLRNRGPVQLGERTTREAEEAWLRQRVQDEAEWLDKKLPGLELKPHQVAALISLAYNIGHAAFMSSTARRFLLAKDWDTACERWLQWNKVKGIPCKGLMRRREAEVALFRS
jgi:lysozyme